MIRVASRARRVLAGSLFLCKIEGSIRVIIMKLATAGLLGMAAVTALAQVPPMETAAGVREGLFHGDRDSLPRSNNASNIVPADTNGTNLHRSPAG
jgi:hypothetical protein